jgi:hypothetical protein
MLLAFGLLTVLGTVFEAFVDEPVFDRFLIPLIPVAVIIVLKPQALPVPPRRSAAAQVSLAALLALSFILTVNGLAFDAARWHGGNRLVRSGISVSAVDAGFDWLGFHSVLPADPNAPVRGGGLPGYATLFPHAPECYVMTASPVQDLGRVVRTFTYRTLLAFGTSRLYVYDTGRCGGRHA